MRRGRIKPVIVDAHYHLEEQMETVEALLEQMQKHGVKRVALIPKLNEPFHIKPIPKKASSLLPPLLMSRLRFLGLLLCNSTVTSDGKLSTLGTKYLLDHKPDNTYIQRVIQEHPDRFFGWIFVNPVMLLIDANNAFSADEAQELMKQVGECDLFWFEEPFVEDVNESAEFRCFLRDQGYRTFLADGKAQGGGVTKASLKF
jgi:hypothetical protein